MAVVSSKLARTGHSKSGDGRYTTLYRVETDDKLTFPLSVIEGGRLLSPLAHDPIPQWGEIYNIADDLDLFSFATRFDARNEDAKFPHKWLVQVSYEPLVVGQHYENPLDREPLWWVESNRHSKQSFKDAAGAPITNAVGRLLPDPVELDSANLILRAVRNVETEEEVAADSAFYSMTTNDAAWPSSLFAHNGIESWLCHPIESSPLQVQNSRQFCTASYRFEYNSDTWREFIIDRGVLYKDGSGNVINESDFNGNIVGEMVNLETDGTRRSDASTPLFINGAGSPAGVQTIASQSWTGIGLDF